MTNLTPVPTPQTPDLPGFCLAITEHSPLPIATVDGATHIVRYGNPAFCQLMEKPLAELIGKPLSELLPEKDVCVSLLDRVFRYRKPESYTEQDPSKPHPVFWSYTMWPVMTQEHLVGVLIQVTETAKVHEDTVTMNEALLLGSVRQHELVETMEKLNAQLREEIAERKQVETALRESEDRYRNLFNSIDEGFCIIEMILDKCDQPVDFLFVEVNPSFEKQSGLHEPVGKRMRELSPEHESYWFEFFGGVARTGMPVRIVKEARILGRWFDAYAFRIGGPESRKVAVLFNDITERKRNEQALEKAADQISHHAAHLEQVVKERTTKLRESIASLETLTYTMAHDLRAPIRAMKTFTTALLEDVPLDGTGKNYAERIHQAAGRMDQLVNDLLDYGQLTHLEFPIQRVDLKAPIERALTQLAEEIQATGAEIHVQEPFPAVLGNERLLEQIFSNLLGNALKFIKPGEKPKILARTETQDSMIRVWVEDNGIGIAPEYHQKIFGVFQRLHTIEEFRGTGVGLAIVKPNEAGPQIDEASLQRCPMNPAA
jgi:PAS domain S-box-containing protein